MKYGREMRQRWYIRGEVISLKLKVGRSEVKGELPFFEENFNRRKMKSKNFGIFKVRLG